MRRLLKRSRAATGDIKRGSRDQSSVSSGTNLQTDGNVVPERPSMPEYPGDRARTDGNGGRRSVVADQRSDSGFYDIGTESTDGADTPRWKVLERQDEVISSGRSSLTSLVRLRRQRMSLRSFRVRSEQFVLRRMRPSCLRRRDKDDDDVYVPASRRRSSDSAVAAVGSWLGALRTNGGLEMQNCSSLEVAAGSQTRRSSRSDAATVLSVDASVSNDVRSWLESPSSWPSSMPYDQVGL